eukprot:4694492-Pleurochrysis_carterae.AAC.5
MLTRPPAPARPSRASVGARLLPAKRALRSGFAWCTSAGSSMLAAYFSMGGVTSAAFSSGSADMTTLRAAHRRSHAGDTIGHACASASTSLGVILIEGISRCVVALVHSRVGRTPRRLHASAISSLSLGRNPEVQKPSTSRRTWSRTRSYTREMCRWLCAHKGACALRSSSRPDCRVLLRIQHTQCVHCKPELGTAFANSNAGPASDLTEGK